VNCFIGTPEFLGHAGTARKEHRPVRVRAREVTESEPDGNISQGDYEIFHRQAGDKEV
jgi:hypothetical protein